MSSTGWIGVDLDGTLAHYDGWHGIEHIGEPVAPVVRQVRQWLLEGQDVRIFTARVCDPLQAPRVVEVIEAWCKEHIGRVLPVTNVKDFGMMELWDDRCVRVVPNEGVEWGSAPCPYCGEYALGTGKKDDGTPVVIRCFKCGRDIWNNEELA